MTITFTDAKPFDDDQWENENQYTPSGRNFVHSGIVRTRDGFSALNGLEVTPGSSGMQVDTNTGVAHLMGFRCELDTPGSNTLSNGDITNDRIDLIIAKVDLSLNTRTIEVKEGTPAATPSAPVITRNASVYELALMELLVPANETDINNCTFTPRYSYTDGIADLSTNLNKNYPSRELADGTQPFHWLTEDGTVTLTEEDATGEGVTVINERILKVVNDGSGGGKYVGQTYVFADEPTLTAEKTRVSASVLVWAEDAGNITLDLYDDGGAASLASVTKEAVLSGWLRLTLEDILIGTTSLTTRVSHDTNSVTYEICNPGLWASRMAFPWAKRPTEYVERLESSVISLNPADANYHDVDLSSFVSPLAVSAIVAMEATRAANVSAVFTRTNGSSEGLTAAATAIKGYENYGGEATVLLDASQIFEYAAGTVGITSLIISLKGYSRYTS